MADSALAALTTASALDGTEIIYGVQSGGDVKVFGSQVKTYVFTTAVALNIKSASSTGGVGYGTGAGSTVAQATDKTTGVTLNNVTGTITLTSAALASSTAVGFTFTNSTIAATDLVLVNIKSGATANSYSVNVDAVAAGSCHVALRNYSSGSLSEAVVLSYAVIKGVAA